MILDLLAIAAVFLGVACIVIGLILAITSGNWFMAAVIVAAIVAGIWLVRA